MDNFKERFPEQIVINLVDMSGLFNDPLSLEITDEFPHVEREYLKYIRHCKKNKIDIAGTVQFVPVDNYALNLVNTMKNEYIDAYDEEYKYIANVFCIRPSNIKFPIDNKCMRRGFLTIKKMADSIGAKVTIDSRVARWIKNDFEEIFMG